jgi:hypothetical protein
VLPAPEPKDVRADDVPPERQISLPADQRLTEGERRVRAANLPFDLPVRSGDLICLYFCKKNFFERYEYQPPSPKLANSKNAARSPGLSQLIVPSGQFLEVPGLFRSSHLYAAILS